MTDTTAQPETPDRPTPRQINEHVHDALAVLAEQQLNGRPEPWLQAELAEWLDTIADRISYKLDVARTPRGRMRPKTLRVDVHATLPGPGENVVRLCRLRARHLLTADGKPVDTVEAVRTLMLQLGHGIPDDVSSLDGDRS